MSQKTRWVRSKEIDRSKRVSTAEVEEKNIITDPNVPPSLTPIKTRRKRSFFKHYWDHKRNNKKSEKQELSFIVDNDDNVITTQVKNVKAKPIVYDNLDDDNDGYSDKCSKDNILSMRKKSRDSQYPADINPYIFEEKEMFPSPDAKQIIKDYPFNGESSNHDIIPVLKRRRRRRKSNSNTGLLISSSTSPTTVSPPSQIEYCKLESQNSKNFELYTSLGASNSEYISFPTQVPNNKQLFSLFCNALDHIEAFLTTPYHSIKNTIELMKHIHYCKSKVSFDDYYPLRYLSKERDNTNHQLIIKIDKNLMSEYEELSNIAIHLKEKKKMKMSRKKNYKEDDLVIQIPDQYFLIGLVYDVKATQKIGIVCCEFVGEKKSISEQSITLYNKALPICMIFNPQIQIIFFNSDASIRDGQELVFIREDLQSFFHKCEVLKQMMDPYSIDTTEASNFNGEANTENEEEEVRYSFV